MSTSHKKAGLPIFDGDEDNYDKWQIQWKAFAQVETWSVYLGRHWIQTWKPSHLEMVMRKIWDQNGGNKGIITQVAAKKINEIMLNAYAMCIRRNATRHHIVPQRNRNAMTMVRVTNQPFKGLPQKCNLCGKQDIRK